MFTTANVCSANAPLRTPRGTRDAPAVPRVDCIAGEKKENEQNNKQNYVSDRLIPRKWRSASKKWVIFSLVESKGIVPLQQWLQHRMHISINAALKMSKALLLFHHSPLWTSSFVKSERGPRRYMQVSWILKSPGWNENKPFSIVVSPNTLG